MDLFGKLFFGHLCLEEDFTWERRRLAGQSYFHSTQPARCILVVCLCLFLLGSVIPPVFATTPPPPILIADVAGANAEQRLTAVSLQALANQYPDGPRVFLLTHPQDADWLQYCLRLTPRSTQEVTLDELLETLKPETKGQVLYDPNELYTINLATTASGLYQAVITAHDLGLPTVLDLRHRWTSSAQAYGWAIKELLPRCDLTRAALLRPGSINMRDFAIQQRMFVLSPPAQPDDENYQNVLFHLPPGAAIYGEAEAGVRAALSRFSHYFVPASQAANLSFLARIDQQKQFHQYLGYLEPSAPRYLTLIFDCSDLGFVLNEMPTIWEHPARGTLPLGWALPASLVEAAPVVIHRYYADAYLSGMDQFMLSASGAGELDLSAATSPFVFFKKTASAHEAWEVHTDLYLAPRKGLDEAAVRFAAETGARGLFVVDMDDLRPSSFGSIPVLAAPRVDSVQAAISYLDHIPMEQRFAALCLNPHTLTPGDAAHIAAYVAHRFLLVPPEEMIQVMQMAAIPPGTGKPTATITSVDYPQEVKPDTPIPIKAVVDGSANYVSVIYRPTQNPLTFWQPLVPSSDGYWCQLPPIRCGGEVEMRIRCVDTQGRIAWSPVWTVTIPETDADNDGLADAEEIFLLTAPDSPDSDSDGLRDGNDPSPLRFDQVSAAFCGLVDPPSDSPYLTDADGTTAGAQGRIIAPGKSCSYRLPMSRVPPGGSVLLAVNAEGLGAIALASDAGSYSTAYQGELSGGWHSTALPSASYPGGVFLLLHCPEEADHALLVKSLTLISDPAGPSIARTRLSPPNPAPGLSLTVSALIFSPRGVIEASLTYRINERGEITIPMRERGCSQIFEADIPSLDNGDRLEWWITAWDSEGNKASTPITFTPVGGRAREVVSMLAIRDFAGEWEASSDWEGKGHVSPRIGARDAGTVNLTGGTYSLWALVGGRGQRIGITVDNSRIGASNPDQPDGWQLIGRIRLEAGRHRVEIISEAGQSFSVSLTPVEQGLAPATIQPRYADVIFSADPNFVPPTNQVLDIYNTLVLISPTRSQTLTGSVTLKATGAGNLTGAEFSLDNQSLRRVSGPPFELSLNTMRLPNGAHLLHVEGLDRAGLSGLAIEIPVIIANP